MSVALRNTGRNVSIPFKFICVSFIKVFIFSEYEFDQLNDKGLKIIGLSMPSMLNYTCAAISWLFYQLYCYIATHVIVLLHWKSDGLI